jgi:hypothetical protein
MTNFARVRSAWNNAPQRLGVDPNRLAFGESLRGRAVRSWHFPATLECPFAFAICLSNCLPPFQFGVDASAAIRLVF